MANNPTSNVGRMANNRANRTCTDYCLSGPATYYVHKNPSGAVFVKGADFFIRQGGLKQPWGETWLPVNAGSIELARTIGDAFLVLPSRTPTQDRVESEDAGRCWFQCGREGKIIITNGLPQGRGYNSLIRFCDYHSRFVRERIGSVLAREDKLQERAEMDNDGQGLNP